MISDAVSSVVIAVLQEINDDVYVFINTREHFLYYLMFDIEHLIMLYMHTML